jgi:BirA family transcriptional regulator, biotin operon repressor / biotin---[acetyl-CoA-carboxylase] ligase
MSSNLIGNNIIRLDSVDSTNNYAAKLINQPNIPFGTVIMSRFQTSGKGQRASNWISSKNENLLFSIILDTSFLNSAYIFKLSKAISIALKIALSEIVSNDISIKWPNDIFADSCKIAGILIENQWAATSLKSSIIGIGLNVNQIEFDSSLSATSLRLLTKSEHVIDDVLNLIIKSLNFYFEALMKGSFSLIDEMYLNHLLRFQEWSKYKLLSGEVFDGKIIGVSNNGLLSIEDRSGQVNNYDLKEINFVL